MIAKDNPGGQRMPMPKAGPENNSPTIGMPDSTSPTGVWKYSANSGANTNEPHMP